MRPARALAYALAAAAATAGGCREAARMVFSQPDVRFAGARLTTVGLEGGTLDVGLVVHNPNPYPLTATRASYRLLSGDSSEVGRGSVSRAFRVAARDSASVTLPIALSWKALERVGRGAIRGGEVAYRVIGEIEVETPIGVRTVPVDARGRTQAPRGLR